MPSARLSEGEVVDQIIHAVGSPASIGANEIVAAPGAGFRLVVYGWIFSATGGANTANLIRSSVNPISAQYGLLAQAGIVVPPSVIPLHELPENERLGVMLTAATTVGVDLWYARARA